METEQFVEQLEELARRLAPYHLVMTSEIKHRLHLFSSQLVRWNRRYALLSRRDALNVVRKHVAASLSILLLASADRDTRWVDVGSGAGLPGLVLKAWHPEQEIVLIEGSRRKCVFMQNTARELGLGPMEILPARVETLVARGEQVGAFQVLLARAVADITATLRDFGPLVKEGGKILTFKGPGWKDDVDSAVASGILENGRFHLEEVMVIPWTQGRVLQIHKSQLP